MTTLVIVCGLPGSGKTTLARSIAEQTDAVRFCPDEWLADLAIDHWDEAARDRLEQLQWRFAERLLTLGTSVVIEWGTWARSERDRLRTRARTLGARVELRLLDAPDEELLRRIAERGFEEPPITAEQLSSWRAAFEAPTAAELELYDNAVPAAPDAPPGVAPAAPPVPAAPVAPPRVAPDAPPVPAAPAAPPRVAPAAPPRVAPAASAGPPPALIVIRGNSASGKTTLAADLQRAMGRGTANIGQDHFRRVVLREHDVPHGDNIDLIRSTVEHCGRLGYHVILEGILFSGHYGAMVQRLIRAHRGPSHVFYLDVSLEETMRRHASRPLSATVAPERMREWYVPRDLLGLPDEVVLDGLSDAAELLRVVRAHVGPVEPRASVGGARFR